MDINGDRSWVCIGGHTNNVYISVMRVQIRDWILWVQIRLKKNKKKIQIRD